jgi:hypothetical protein
MLAKTTGLGHTHNRQNCEISTASVRVDLASNRIIIELCFSSFALAEMESPAAAPRALIHPSKLICGSPLGLVAKRFEYFYLALLFTV